MQPVLHAPMGADEPADLGAGDVPGVERGDRIHGDVVGALLVEPDGMGADRATNERIPLRTAQTPMTSTAVNRCRTPRRARGSGNRPNTAIRDGMSTSDPPSEAMPPNWFRTRAIGEDAAAGMAPRSGPGTVWEPP